MRCLFSLLGRFGFLSCFFLLPLFVSAQCITSNRAVPDSGEKLTLSAYFNWSAVWIKGGEAVFTAKKSGSSYLYDVHAYTLPKWKWIYSLDTHIKAVMNAETLKPVSCYSETEEDGKWHAEKFEFLDGNMLRVQTWSSRDANPVSATVEAPDCSYDLLNEVYASRNIDLHSHEIGENLYFNVFFTSQMTTITGQVVGYETIRTRNGKTYKCVKCKSNSIPGSIFDSSQPVYIWVTDNERLIPVMVKCKISVGNIVVYLDSVE